MTNTELYGSLPRVTDVIQQRRLALAGHVIRSEEPAGKLIFWLPEYKQRVGQPISTIRQLLLDETELQENELVSVMKNRDYWRKYFVKASPLSSG